MKRFLLLFPLRWLTVSWLAGLLLLGFAAQAQTYDAVVARDGSGQFTTVQAAINAAPTGRTALYTIFIKNGKYKEVISIPSNKPFLQLIGQSVANTILTYDNYSGKPMPGGGTYNTGNSASVTFNAPDCSALNLTIENTTGDAPQALAVSVSADRVAFKNCRFLGGQDTVLTNGPANRCYFKDCYIDGVVDFIFGGAVAVFEGCVIYPKTRRDGGSGGYITAVNTPQGQAYGYVFRKCYVPANRGTTTYSLGRPWQNDAGSTTASRSNNKVVWIGAVYGPGIIMPAGWSTWDAGTVTSVITYAEHKSRNLDGSLADVSQRVSWSRQLTDADTATYSRSTVLGTWNPCATLPNFCPSQAREIAVANFVAVKGTATVPSNLTWNISWPIAGVQYQVFRSSTRSGAYTQLYTTTAANGNDVNFGTTDAIPAPGASYYYYVRASKSGLATHITDTLTVSSTPTITATGSFQQFVQGANTPSASQRITITAENLTSGITATPPASFQVSADNTTWYGSTSPLSLPVGSTGTLTSTALYVRLNASTVGTYSGNLTLTATGAATVTLPLSGTAQATALPQSTPQQWWPMSTTGGQDSTAIRSAAVSASTPTFRKFVLSSNSAAATIPPYSARYGQAFSPLPDGSWLSSQGGNGGNLNRTYYEQFTVTNTSTNRTVRADSVLFTNYVNGSSSNTKVALVWSRSNFATDSADVTGGKGPAGILLSTANGGFTTPVTTPGSAVTYRLALAGATGVTLQPGQRLTFRMYFSCGSTATATRFSLLKNVVVLGETRTTLATTSALHTDLAMYPNPASSSLRVPHAAAGSAARVQLYNATGARVLGQPVVAGTTDTTLNLASLVPGIYLVEYTDGTNRHTARLVKE